QTTSTRVDVQATGRSTINMPGDLGVRNPAEGDIIATLTRTAPRMSWRDPRTEPRRGWTAGPAPGAADRGRRGGGGRAWYPAPSDSTRRAGPAAELRPGVARAAPRQQGGQ